VTVDNCELSLAGLSGLHVGAGCSDLTVSRTWVHSVGGDGLGLASPDTANASVMDCVVEDAGHIFLSQPAGIRLKGQGITATHNLVQNVP